MHLQTNSLYLVGMGTSVSPVSSTAGDRRTNATMDLSKKSSSPTSTLDASAPVGIFFMKCVSTYGKRIIAVLFLCYLYTIIVRIHILNELLFSFIYFQYSLNKNSFSILLVF